MYRMKLTNEVTQRETYDEAPVGPNGVAPVYTMLSRHFEQGHFYPARWLPTNNEIEILPLLMCDPAHCSATDVRIVLTWQSNVLQSK
jgi:hypothetical protein